MKGQINKLSVHFVGYGECKGYQFRQICVTNRGFIYEVDTGGTSYYEVFKRRVNRRFATISYPGSNSFGIWAWTTPNLDRAKEILASFQG